MSGNKNPASRISSSSSSEQNVTNYKHSAQWEALRRMTIQSDLAYNKKDFTMAALKCVEAIKLATALPEPISSSEAIRIKINLSNIYMQKGDHTNAMKTIVDCAEHGERFVGLQKLHGKPEAVQQASDMLQTAYLSGTQGLLFIHSNKPKEVKENTTTIELDTAASFAEKAVHLAAEYMEENDPLQFKALRAVAITKDAQGNPREAEKYMLLAFNKVASSNDGKHAEMQEFISDEYTKMVMRRKDITTALNHAKKDYELLLEKKLPTNHLMISDSCVRLGQLLMCIPERFPEAETNLSRALEIRQKQYSIDRTKIKVISLADTMVMLNRVREANSSKDENLKLLMRAKELYAEVPIQEKISSPFFQALEQDIVRNSDSSVVNGIESMKTAANGGGGNIKLSNPREKK